MSTARPSRLRELPRNVWAASGASFLTDVSSEMILNLVPLFLMNVVGLGTAGVGLVEGMAETTASAIKLASGRLSDRVGRKRLAVAGYALSTLAKPGLAWASSWAMVAAARWTERVGKGIRTAPRDALVADSIEPEQRGMAFGFHRAADTGGAVTGLAIALAVVWALQGGSLRLEAGVFRTLVWLSVLPAALGVLCLALGAREVARRAPSPGSAAGRPRLGRRFGGFLAIVAVFELGNSADAFLVLRAQERGVAVAGILLLLMLHNAVYAAVSAPAGRLSDRLGRRPLLVAGWALYAAVYVGFARARAPWHLGALFALYGIYHGLAAGATRAFVADLVPESLRGTAYGAYHATVGLVTLPASLLAGLAWQGAFDWPGLGAAAPFWLGAGLAASAAAILALWRPDRERAGPASGLAAGAGKRGGAGSN